VLIRGWDAVDFRMELCSKNCHQFHTKMPVVPRSASDQEAGKVISPMICPPITTTVLTNLAIQFPEQPGQADVKTGRP
jgi:hypothetical protein